MRTKFLLTCLLIVLAPWTGARGDDIQQPPILREVELRQNLNAQTPLDADFRDEQGQTVTLGDCIAGKPTILVLAYYRCPKLCTQVLNDLALGMKNAPLTLGNDYNIVTVSFDDRETPEMAAAKKESYVNSQYYVPGMEKGWHFLTGRQQPILRLANAVGFQFRYDPKNDLFAHRAALMVLTPAGKMSRYLLRLRDEANPRPFERDLRFALEEASTNKIGPRTDDILLFCFKYDPETGRYTMTALNLVRAAGAVTIVVLGSLLFVMWRRERRKNKPGAPATGVSPVASAPG